MSDYTPTTEEVRNQYSGLSTAHSNHAGQVYINFAEFDRWLAEVKAQAWEEGYDSGAERNYMDSPSNPYRQGEEQ